MKLALVVLLIPVLLLAWWLLRLRTKYRSLFDDHHLFHEMPDLIGRLKTEALSAGDQEAEAAEDPRLGVTSAGLGIFFTTEDLPEGLYTHVSCSYSGGPIAFSFGGRCAYVMLDVLGVDPSQAVVAHSPGGFLHLAFLTPDERREAFTHHTPGAPPTGRLEALKEEAGEWMQNVLKSGALLRSEDELLAKLLQARGDSDENSR